LNFEQRISNFMNTYIISQKALILPKIPSINLGVFWISTVILIAALLVFYIFQANWIVSESYQIQNYQRKLNELARENEILEINSAQVNSLGNVEQLVEGLNFEKVGQVHYIRVLESQIVTK